MLNMRFVLCLVILSMTMTMNLFAEEPPKARDRTYRLDVSFDIAGSRIIGRMTAPVGAGETVRLQIGPLRVVSAMLNGAAVESTLRDGILSASSAADGVLEIRYEGVFRGGEAVGDKNFGVVSSTIDQRGISLTGLWHPRPAGLAVWKLTATLPEAYEAVSEAEGVSKTRAENGVRFTFDFPHPVDGLTLVATDRYEVTRERHGDVEIAAYFFPEDRELAKTYLQSTKKYLDLYESMLTPFPYRRFAVVENFLPTGYSMPTFTLLGQDVVRLPFITETSLGHEILHQWFGNSVYVDYERGNWVEGLTTYLADHWYEELKGRGWEYRKQLLVNHAAYAHGKSELSLREFRSRMDLASRAVGYGKAAMVFHMLRVRTGDEKFFGALRDVIKGFPFKEVSWDDLAAVFTKKAEADLAPFFAAWVDGKGLPEIGIESASVRRKAGRFEISLALTRKGGAFPLEVPVSISFLSGGAKKESITLDAERKDVKLFVDEEPGMTVLDPDYDLARRPTADELPPVIARLLGDEKPLIAAARDTAAYEAVIDEYAKGGTRDDVLRTNIKDADIRTSTLVVLGADHPVVSRLFGTIEVPQAGFSVMIRRNPWNRDKIVAIFHSRSAEEAAAGVRKLGHYGKYSFLSFDAGRNREKRIDPAERGIIVSLRSEPVALDLRLLRTLSSVLEGAADRRIVYVGEYHDRFSHHTIQLQVIQALHRKHPDLAVGMEMFQRPFQKTLDEYIAGSIDEREFLRRSEYFKRWVFDYNLYKPVLDYCRAGKIPVVALNIRREITEKVSKEGMDALSDEERKELPRAMDVADEDYRSRLRQVFDQHKGSGDRNFDFFLQAQVIWDEVMAESIADYLERNPDRRMVVLAGGGHVAYGAGIPKRAFRRNSLSYAVILNDGDIDPAIADYIVFPEQLDGLTAPKLMATFKEEGTRLLFSDFAKDSPAKQAGVEAGDALIALDGLPVEALADIKLALHYKNPGDLILVTVARKRFLFGEKVMTLEVKL
jgi:uncharacterized iron-regulated protein